MAQPKSYGRFFLASAVVLLVLFAMPTATMTFSASGSGHRLPFKPVPTRTASGSAQDPMSPVGQPGTPRHFPPLLPLGSRAPPSVVGFDEQLGMTFTQNFTSLEYNVTAVEQTDPGLGDGPAYLLNGLSDLGYWYQVGLAWNWAPGQVQGYGFSMAYEVFNNVGNSIFPAGDQAGLMGFNGTVNAGDSVLLNLYFSNATRSVVMVAEDVTDGASAYQTFPAYGSSYFAGLGSSVANSNGFFTGLMTEWYHGGPYYANEQQVVYSNPHFALSSAWMWMDEFNASDYQAIFSSNTQHPLAYDGSGTLLTLAYNGTTEYSNAYGFVSGALSSPVTSLSLSAPAYPPSNSSTGPPSGANSTTGSTAYSTSSAQSVLYVNPTIVFVDQALSRLLQFLLLLLGLG